MNLYGNEGDACEVCGHLYCYHSEADEEDGTIAGCQIKDCICDNVYVGEIEG